MKIVIVGSGNVASVLGKELFAAGHFITQVVAHQQWHQAAALAAMLHAEVISELLQLDVHADLYLLAISDSALPGVAKSFPTVTGIVLHTAGAVSIHVLANTSGRYGVLYPLQSLRKEKTAYGHIPLLIDGNTGETLQSIQQVAGSISSLVQQSDDASRLRLHTAAVIVSNFTNHLYTLTYDYCSREGLDFSLLVPLITETADRLWQYAPAQMQTGPAARNDVVTIAKHVELLAVYPSLQLLYNVLTTSIQQYQQEQ